MVSLMIIMAEDLLKCSGCKCLFVSENDLGRHVNKFGRNPHLEAFERLHHKIESGNEEETGLLAWHKAKFGTGEIAFAENDPSLTRSIECQGEVRMGKYLYTLSNDKKWILRKVSME